MANGMYIQSFEGTQNEVMNDWPDLKGYDVSLPSDQELIEIIKFHEEREEYEICQEYKEELEKRKEENG